MKNEQEEEWMKREICRLSGNDDDDFEMWKRDISK